MDASTKRYVSMVLQHFKVPRYNLFLSKLKRKIYTNVCPLSVRIHKSKEPVPFAQIGDLQFSPCSAGDKWGGMFDCAWLELAGKLKGDYPVKDLVAIINVGAEGCVYTEDGPLQGLTGLMSAAHLFQTRIGKQVVPLSRIGVKEDGSLHFWVDCGNNGLLGRSKGQAKFKRADICLFRADLFRLYYDFFTAYQTMENIEDEEKRGAFKKVLDKAIRLAGNLSASGAEQALAALQELYTGEDKTDFTIYGVGHAHLDLAWLWPLRETKRKAVRTFTNALYYIENNPDYVFGTSQPQLLEWMQEEYPGLYERIKKAVNSGNIELQGGMWTEPDTNLPCGESLIRQFYYGQNFFLKEFGRYVNYLWVPDVFGYTAALPQIIKKCGADYFMTIKISWNSVNKFPYHTFNWIGLDGSSILTHMPPEGDYNSTASPFTLNYIEKNYSERRHSDIALMPFGAGDGGGGPGEYEVNMIPRANKISAGPRVKFSTAAEFFEKLKENRNGYPSYKGELYLEKHRGTYTTQAFVKKNNRLLERKLHNAEWLSTLAKIYKGAPYPAQELDKIWKQVLLHQFHDILPGSSIKRVYDECRQTYARLNAEVDDIISKAIDTLSAKAKGLYAVNPTHFTRAGYVKYNGAWYAYSVSPYSSCKLSQANESSTELKFGSYSIENGILKAAFDNQGDMISLQDKQSGKEYVKSVFAAARIYKDKFTVPYNAWDIDSNYVNIKPRRLKLVSAMSYIDGQSVVRENKYVFNKSFLVQKIILTAGSPYVVIDNQVSWHEKHKMLRTDFYPADFGAEVLCDIQFGNIKRSTKTDNKIDKAQFEIPAHKWVDVTENGWGVAVLNDCKYGHRVKDGLISVNCLRSTVYPDPTADRGAQEFKLAIYPHKGAALDSELIKIGYELNNPLIIGEEKVEVSGIADCIGESIVIETVLTAKGGHPALRLYESKGRAQNAILDIKIPYKKVVETDMLFNNERPCDTKHLTFEPYEIKTLVIKQ